MTVSIYLDLGVYGISQREGEDDASVACLTSTQYIAISQRKDLVYINLELIKTINCDCNVTASSIAYVSV